MSGGGQQPITQQTTQTRDPWSAAQPHLTGIMNEAARMYGTGVGYQPYTGQTVADVNPWTDLALNETLNMATPDPANAMSRNLAQGMIANNGMTPGLTSMLGQYQSLYDEASSQDNPFLQSMLDAQNRRIGDQINSSMSGAGRYGSGAHTDVMARTLAEASDPILYQDYARRQQQRMQATGAAADLESQGLQRAGQWAEAAPSLYQQQFLPQQAIAGVGSFYDQRAQQQLNDQIKQYNLEQAYPWEQLNRYSALAAGPGALGGSTFTTTPVANQPSTLQKILGGASAGAGIGTMFGPGIGTAVGAGAGGLLGMLA